MTLREVNIYNHYCIAVRQYCSSLIGANRRPSPNHIYPLVTAEVRPNFQSKEPIKLTLNYEESKAKHESKKGTELVTKATRRPNDPTSHDI
jgi:hypothetical protein